MKKNIAILITILFIFFVIHWQSNSFFGKQNCFPKIHEQTEVLTEEYNLNLAMVGDALIHDGVYKDAYVYATKSYDFKPHLSLLKPIISKYDLAFYNQETILGGKELGLSSYPRFNSPYEVGDAFLDAGFNLVSLANNHTLDRGETAILNSIRYWKNQNVYYTGSFSSEKEKHEVKIMEKNNIKYAMVAYTIPTNGLSAPVGKEYLLNVYDEKTVKEEVKQLRSLVDVLIVSMHWGNEYQMTPSQEQIKVANDLAELGVDIVIGTHPHVVQPIVKIGKTLVFYSLGNVISAQDSSGDFQKRIGLLSSINIKKVVEDKHISVEINNTDNELLYTHYENYRHFKIIPFQQMNIKYNKDYQRLYEKYKNVIQSLDQNVMVKNI